MIKFPLDGKNEENMGHACDISLICPDCGLQQIFGVAISKEHFDEYTQWAERKCIEKHGVDIKYTAYEFGKPFEKLDEDSGSTGA